MYQTLGYASLYLVCFLLLITTVVLMSKWLCITPSSHRFQALNGARGICAALVSIFHIFHREPDLAPITFHFMDLSGCLPVGFFFMLSAFLFFRKSLSDNLNIPMFLMGRAKRIYLPVLVVLVCTYFVTLFIGPGPTESFFTAIIRSLPFLAEASKEGMNGVGYRDSGISVFWTLVWEIRLYCIIPLLYWALKPLSLRHKQWLIVLAMVVVHVLNTQFHQSWAWGYTMYFLGGFLMATFVTHDESATKKPCSSWMGLLLLVVALLVTKGPFHTTSALYIAVVFCTIVRGCDYFGFLTSRPIALLGTCSFSIYIAHGIVQYVLMHYFYDTGYQIWGMLSSIVTGVVATLLYHYVERYCVSKH